MTVMKRRLRNIERREASWLTCYQEGYTMIWRYALTTLDDYYPF